MKRNRNSRNGISRHFPWKDTLPKWLQVMVLLCMPLIFEAQQTYSGKQAEAILPGAQFVRMQEDSVFPAFVRFAPGSEVPVGEFMDWLYVHQRTAFKPEFELARRETDDLGHEHLRFVQTFRGIPVDQSDFIVHAKNGNVYAFNGKIRNISLGTVSPTLTESEALKAATTHIGAEKYMWEDPQWETDLRKRKNDAQATYYPDGKLVISASKYGGTRLAYVFDIHALSPMQEIRICIDAMTGEVIYDVPMESHCEPATVNTIFNGSRNINTELYTADDYRLRDDCTDAVIWVRDWNSATLTPSPIEIENTTNTWTTMDEVFGGTTLWCTKRAYSYYLNRFSRDSYDNSNGDVSALINALFDCSPPAGCTTANNASMSFSGGNMKVGLSSSGNLTNAYATIDIIGHEYTHAVTGATAMLVYEDEWGALNESFSDIFGEAIEFFTFGSNDWLMGSERDNGAIRSLSNPNAFGDPDTYLGTNWVTITPPCDGSNDECGVHTNSGVQNFWFFLLVNGGSGTNDNGDAYDVDGIGILDAEAIAYRNLVFYLGANSDYQDARDGAIQAALDMFSECSPEVEAVMDAWYAVGVGDPFLNVTASVTSDYNGADVTCFGADDGSATAVAANGTPPYTFAWSNGDMTADAVNLSAGTYTVTVTDDNNCTATDQVTLINPPMLSATISILSDYNGWPISCFGACDGSIQAEPSGGTAPYTYAWAETSGEATTQVVSGLCAGTHFVTVTDANGCATTAEITLDQPPPLEIEAGGNQTIFYWDLSMACTTLMATGATGGVPPYTYSWSSGGNTATESVCLEEREDTITIVTYTVTLTDANGCEAVDSLNVCYVDINCGSGNNTKVTICHFPPDNPFNPQTLCVSLNALMEHLLHGDRVAECGFMSPCQDGPAPLQALPDQAMLMAQALQKKPLLTAFPDPFSDMTTVRFIVHEDMDVQVSLLDIHGKLIRTVYAGNASAGEINDVDFLRKTLPAGMYVLRLQGVDPTQTVHQQIVIR